MNLSIALKNLSRILKFLIKSFIMTSLIYLNSKYTSLAYLNKQIYIYTISIINVEQYKAIVGKQCS